MEVDNNTAKEEAADYLRSLLNRNLCITTTDSRMFRGQFKCTDPGSNIVLVHTYEYRQPSMQKRALEAANASEAGSIKLDMTARYLGLVVVPGEHVVKIEVEEFASQMKKGGGQNVAVV